MVGNPLEAGVGKKQVISALQFRRPAEAEGEVGMLPTGFFPPANADIGGRTARFFASKKHYRNRGKAAFSILYNPGRGAAPRETGSYLLHISALYHSCCFLLSSKNFLKEDVTSDGSLTV